MKHSQPDHPQAFTPPSVADYAAKLESCWALPLPRQFLPKNQHELDEVLDTHRIWTLSVQDPKAPLAGSRGILRGADLRGMNLARRDLRAIDLRGANLEGANLAHSDLTLAALNGANLRNADLKGACLRYTDLDGADIEGTVLCMPAMQP